MPIKRLLSTYLFSGIISKQVADSNFNKQKIHELTVNIISTRFDILFIITDEQKGSVENQIRGSLGTNSMSHSRTY